MYVCLRAGTQHTSSCCLDHCEPFSSREEMISSTSSLEKHLWHVTGSQHMTVTCLSHDCHMTVMSSFFLLIDSVHLTSKCEVLRINVLTLDSGIPTTLTVCCHVCMHTHTPFSYSVLLETQNPSQPTHRTLKLHTQTQWAQHTHTCYIHAYTCCIHCTHT